MDFQFVISFQVLKKISKYAVKRSLAHLNKFPEFSKTVHHLKAKAPLLYNFHIKKLTSRVLSKNMKSTFNGIILVCLLWIFSSCGGNGAKNAQNAQQPTAISVWHVCLSHNLYKV